MLTPGKWLATGNFWDGFFNPTFWPSFVFRSCISVMLAGLYVLLIASRFLPAEFKIRMVRGAAWWGITGLAGSLLSLSWYWRWIPVTITATALQTMPLPIKALELSYWFAGAIAALLLVFGLAFPRRQHICVAMITMAMGLGWFGSFEWFRESVRKPYVIVDYMYGNGVEVGRTEVYKQNGYLSQLAFRSGDDGADLFGHACRSCHTIQGYLPLKPAFDGTDRAFISAIIKSAHLLRGNMPPFLGTAGEADAIAGYLEVRTDRRPLAAIYGLPGVDLGKKVFDVRCGKCHPIGSTGDKMRTLAGLAEENYQALLDNASEIGAGMPAVTCSESERRALIEYFKILRVGGGK